MHVLKTFVPALPLPLPVKTEDWASLYSFSLDSEKKLDFSSTFRPVQSTVAMAMRSPSRIRGKSREALSMGTGSDCPYEGNFL